MSQLVLHSERRPRHDEVEFDRLVERIAGQFPELDREVIVAVARGEYGRFETSKVRDFVPILVERSVRDELARNNVGRRA